MLFPCLSQLPHAPLFQLPSQLDGSDIVDNWLPEPKLLTTTGMHKTSPNRQQALLFGSNAQCMYHRKQHTQENNKPYHLGAISSGIYRIKQHSQEDNCLGAISSVCTI